MPDLASNVAYQELLRQTKAGKLSQSQAITAPSKYHAEIIEGIAGVILANYRPSHPDMLIIGTSEKPPTVENCRWLIDNIAMKPLEGKKRIAVIMNGDKLNKSAGNSLLKLTEEPPSHAYILFMMEDERIFLPTLRSRVQLTAITADEEIRRAIMPQDPQEWVDWLTEARKSTLDDEKILSDITSWEEYEQARGNLEAAEILEKLRQTAQRKNISIPMLSDLIILMLMDGGNENEDVLNNIRKA